MNKPVGSEVPVLFGMQLMAIMPEPFTGAPLLFEGNAKAVSDFINNLSLPVLNLQRWAFGFIDDLGQPRADTEELQLPASLLGRVTNGVAQAPEKGALRSFIVKQIFDDRYQLYFGFSRNDMALVHTPEGLAFRAESPLLLLFTVMSSLNECFRLSRNPAFLQAGHDWAAVYSFDGVQEVLIL